MATLPFFYPLTDGPARRTGAPWRLLKGVEHVAGLRRLAREARGFDVVHFQWAALPLLDARAARRMRRERPLVLTVHDIKPFNGKQAGVQARGYAAMLEIADRLIVHTEEGRDALRERGLPAERIRIVPHGLLPLSPAPPEPRPADGRWRVVLFGRLQAYKGADLLIEALGRIAPSVRARLDVVIAGEAQIPLEPLRNRAAALALGAALDLRPGRLPESAMAALLRSADAFVFPYRSIDASGVLHLVAGLDRWLIASDLGAFRQMIGAPSGALVPPGDPDALAAAIVRSIGQRPAARPATGHTSWAEIGAMTRAVYAEAITAR